MDTFSDDSILQMAAAALLHRCDRIALVDVSTFACRFIKHPNATQEDRDLQTTGNIVTYFRRALAWGLIHTDDLLECHRRMQQFVADTSRRMDPQVRTLRLRYRLGASFAWTELSLLPIPGQEPHLRLFCLKRSDENTADEALRGVWGQFHKILRVNLTTGTYEAVKLEGEEASHFTETPSHIWEWLHDFASEAHVHPEDMGTYLAFIDRLRSRKVAMDPSSPCKTIYRRRQEEGWRWVIMEVVPSLEYSDDNREVMLYVLDVHDFLAKEKEHNRILHEKTGSTDWDAQLAGDMDLTGLLHSDGTSGPSLIFTSLDDLPPLKS